MKTIYTKTIKKTLFIGIQIKKLRIKVLLLKNTKKMKPLVLKPDEHDN